MLHQREWNQFEVRIFHQEGHWEAALLHRLMAEVDCSEHCTAELRDGLGFSSKPAVFAIDRSKQMGNY